MRLNGQPGQRGSGGRDERVGRISEELEIGGASGGARVQFSLLHGLDHSACELARRAVALVFCAARERTADSARSRVTLTSSTLELFYIRRNPSQ